MSWQEYVDNNLQCPVDAEGSTLKASALVGLENSVWAKSADFPDMSTDEMDVIKAIFDGTNPGSFTIGGLKYMALGSEDPETKMRGKCAGGGCSISKTGKTLVIGIWATPVLASACNKVVEALAEYLVSVDY
eukprot:CAMPEP_0119101372 /NCGR_PEP_ID=MMETSP1180-20130426/445_1 /TAXON_ID=3052 ORGANISM="Chlamydomonas cf sp, Strain CCMP681" /NCGR_SAMPLE_ID=MMETSP1180 /ASSEMBLY_ACC=CAM_ASM_000741 /LENGTH=131 /DNA_ID=CAMNT_0007085487 /DNA_START=29 /DNA_END=424 /DNA_ORIENTATION=+